MKEFFKARQLVKLAACSAALLLPAPDGAQQGDRLQGADEFTSTVLWTGGVGGYATYRIPGIVSTKRGVLLAYISARKGTSDWADIDIVMRRSTDHGKTWSDSRRIAGETQGTTDNPVAIVDYQTGAVHFLFQHNYERVYYMRSDDDGTTFTKPVDITGVFEQFRPEYDWHVIAPGVGHALQLKNGRLLVPLWMSTGTPTGPKSRAHRPSAVATIYSDDHGRSWKRGAIIVNSSGEIPNPSESMAVQLADGRVMMSIRNESTRYRRVYSISPDGATNWSKPEFDEGLFEPICAASIVRFAASPADPDARILFSNPDSSDLQAANANRVNRPRQMLTVKLSTDSGRSWTQHRVLDPGVAGYSDLAVDAEKSIYVLYEEGSVKGSETFNTHAVLAKFPIDWLMKGDPKF